jgi:hypothetical protein
LCRYTPGVGQLVEELPPGARRQSLQGQGPAQQVAAQVLELLAAVRGQGDVGVEGEPSLRAPVRDNVRQGTRRP